MPRKPDSTLEARILNAARKLWIKGGDEALSMRAVARAAKTNTPAIYRRFRNRKQILRALLRSAQDDLYKIALTCASLEEAGLRLFEFAMTRQREYQLVTGGLIGRINEPQPVFELIKKRCAEWFGGSPEDHTKLLVAVWSAAHGTALLIMTRTVPKYAEEELRSALPAMLDVLVRNRAMLALPATSGSTQRSD